MNDNGGPDFEPVWDNVACEDGTKRLVTGVRVNPRVWLRFFAAAAIPVFLEAVTKADRWLTEPEEGVESAAGAAHSMADALLAAMEAES